MVKKRRRKLKHLDLDILSNDDIDNNQIILKRALNECGVSYRDLYTTGCELPMCTWNTLQAISQLDIPFNVIVSGGGVGEFCQISMSKINNYGDVRNLFQARVLTKEMKVGIIDTGSLPPNTVDEKDVIMHPQMFNTNYRQPKYTTYTDNSNLHGTAVTEIIRNGLFNKAKIYVARVSQGEQNTINATCLVSAMLEFQRLKLDIINFSLSGMWKNNRVYIAIKSLQTSGAVVVAAAGNYKPDTLSDIVTQFNNGTTIIVGSHSVNNKISSFSRGHCHVNVCALGENVFVKNCDSRHYRSGTSLSTAQVTAVCANYMAFAPSEECYLLKEKLAETADDLACMCSDHNGRNVKLKMNAVTLLTNMKHDNATTSKRMKLEESVVVGQ